MDLTFELLEEVIRWAVDYLRTTDLRSFAPVNGLDHIKYTYPELGNKFRDWQEFNNICKFLAEKNIFTGHGTGNPHAYTINMDVQIKLNNGAFLQKIMEDHGIPTPRQADDANQTYWFDQIIHVLAVKTANSRVGLPCSAILEQLKTNNELNFKYLTEFCIRNDWDVNSYIEGRINNLIDLDLVKKAEIQRSSFVSYQITTKALLIYNDPKSSFKYSMEEKTPTVVNNITGNTNSPVQLNTLATHIQQQQSVSIPVTEMEERNAIIDQLIAELDKLKAQIGEDKKEDLEVALQACNTLKKTESENVKGDSLLKMGLKKVGEFIAVGSVKAIVDNLIKHSSDLVQYIPFS